MRYVTKTYARRWKKRWGLIDQCGQRMHLVARRATAVCRPINLHAFGGPDSPVDEKSGDATGIGDIVLRAKYHLYKGPVADIAGAL